MKRSNTIKMVFGIILTAGVIFGAAGTYDALNAGKGSVAEAAGRVVSIDSCTISGDSVVVDVSAENLPGSDDGKYYLYADEVYQDGVTGEVVATTDKGKKATFKFDLALGKKESNLSKKFLVAVKSGGSMVQVSDEHYITNPEAIASKTVGRNDHGIKGILPNDADAATFKDLGIDFGDKYRAVDPKQTTSKEVEITNEHNFVNGFCVDCGLSWGEYFYDVVGKLMHVDLGNGQHYTRGQYSSTMLTPGDKVSCAADKPHFGSINYESRVYDKDKGTSKDEFCYIDYSFDDSELRTQLYYSISQRLLLDNAASYDYTLTVRAKPGEYNKIFKSKDALKKYVDVSLSIRGSDINDYIENAWEKMKEDEIKKKFDSDGLTYYTKDEIIDMFWDHHINYFESMDNGMVWMKTSLADIGFNWKE